MLPIAQAVDLLTPPERAPFPVIASTIGPQTASSCCRTPEASSVAQREPAAKRKTTKPPNGVGCDLGRPTPQPRSFHLEVPAIGSSPSERRKLDGSGVSGGPCGTAWEAKNCDLGVPAPNGRRRRRVFFFCPVLGPFHGNDSQPGITSSL